MPSQLNLIFSCLISIIIPSVLGDPFICDEDLGLEPLYSHSYTCDGIKQCIDGGDEEGCTSCLSGNLLLTGLQPSSPLFEFETVFVKQDYLLRNRGVYKASGAYLTYNAESYVWVISRKVDSGAVFLSSTTRLDQPFLREISWRIAGTDEAVEGLQLECVPAGLDRCTGDLLLVTPNSVNRLSPTLEYSLARPIYRSSQLELRFSNPSEEWSTPFWQVVNITGSREVFAFPRSSALYPEFITTPGVYRGEEGGSLAKSSNVYLTCAFNMPPTDEANSVDCPFQEGMCGWDMRGDIEGKMGAAEQFTIGSRILPSLHFIADDTTAGKTRITSPRFDLNTESCVAVRLASTVNPVDFTSLNFTVNIKDVYGTTVGLELDECTYSDEDAGGNCSLLDHVTKLVDIDQTGTNIQMEMVVSFGLNKQPSGVISISEVTLLDGPCRDVELGWVEPCFDLTSTCGGSTCLNRGLRIFECKCGEGKYGDTCGEDLPSCPQLEELDLVRGRAFLECEEQLADSVPNPRLCQGTGDWTDGYDSCTSVPCPSSVPHADLTQSSSSVPGWEVTCPSGYFPSSPLNVTCHHGTWRPADNVSTTIPPCTFSCANQVGNASRDLLDTVGVNIELVLKVCREQGECVETTRDVDSLPWEGTFTTDVAARVSQNGGVCLTYADGEVSYSGRAGDGVECLDTCTDAYPFVEETRRVGNTTLETMSLTLRNFEYGGCTDSGSRGIRVSNTLGFVLAGVWAVWTSG